LSSSAVTKKMMLSAGQVHMTDFLAQLANYVGKTQFDLLATG
jgi:hypothetical protein